MQNDEMRCLYGVCAEPGFKAYWSEPAFRTLIHQPAVQVLLSKDVPPLKFFSRGTRRCHLKLIPCLAFYPITIYSALYNKQAKVEKKVIQKVTFRKKKN